MTREIEEKASNYMRGRVMALSFKPLSLQDIKEAYLCGAEDYAHISESINPWHKASEELPKDRVFLAHCIGMSRGFIDRILWNARNGGFDNLNDTFPSASIKESHFEDYYDYWMEIPELQKEKEKD